MASAEDSTAFIDILLPDSRHPSDEPNIQERSVSKFLNIVMQLPKGATVVQLEYWGRNRGPKKLHHFLCATIQLPGGEL